ncbi:flagellar hook-basal body complex protein FliE [Breoghania sp.]|uniref:flagellar hook-basal body complex protein FliE n=1 Tax=Breoghania sp. TaxID=2065378 RepID=UPI0029C9CE35|nr:flagellar hook-basal body complex protein FliE [Breoghania sp.]
MTIPSIAANAYQNTARLTGQGGSQSLGGGLGGALGGKSGSTSFGDMVETAVQGVVDQGRVADTKTVDMMNGKANVVDVVTAVSETEVALQTMVSVRDKVIAAYEEIMRMSI